MIETKNAKIRNLLEKKPLVLKAGYIKLKAGE